ncbi:MAG: hypothetical protein ACXWOV_02925, partial [Isosphaeraceae bacterium]
FIGHLGRITGPVAILPPSGRQRSSALKSGAWFAGAVLAAIFNLFHGKRHASTDERGLRALQPENFSIFSVSREQRDAIRCL